MPLNLLKKYPQLLELAHLNEKDRTDSLMRIFKRDIEDNAGFAFRKKQIRPLKKDGQTPMQVLFHHLTTRGEKDEKGNDTKARSFEMARSQRLHWLRHHTQESGPVGVEIFSYEDRIGRKDVIRTYIYDTAQEYVIILEPQRSRLDYYLITAYHLNEPGGKKQIQKKKKGKLAEVY
ncbi:MAG: hypothetical protein ACOYOE_11765 [Chlorobium sp.]